MQEAKQKFGELVRRTVEEEPQTVTRHGEEVVVVVLVEEYRRLREGKPDFKEFLLSGPELDKLRLERQRDDSRDVPLS